MTLSTSTGQTKGSYSIPPSKPFPIPYNDNFECECSIRVYYSHVSGLAYEEPKVGINLSLNHSCQFIYR